eukprot:148434_1
MTCTQTWKDIKDGVQLSKLTPFPGPTITKSNTHVRTQFYQYDNKVIIKWNKTFDTVRHPMDHWRNEFLKKNSTQKWQQLIKENIFTHSEFKGREDIKPKLFSITLLRELKIYYLHSRKRNEKSVAIVEQILNYYDEQILNKNNPPMQQIELIDNKEHKNEQEEKDTEHKGNDIQGDIWKFELKHQLQREEFSEEQMKKINGNPGCVNISAKDWYKSYRQTIIFSTDVNCPHFLKEGLQDEKAKKKIITMNKSPKQLSKTSNKVTGLKSKIRKIVPWEVVQSYNNKYEEGLHQMVREINKCYHLISYEEKCSSNVTVIVVTKPREDGPLRKYKTGIKVTKLTSRSIEPEVKYAEKTNGKVDEFTINYIPESATKFMKGSIKCITSEKGAGTLWHYKDSINNLRHEKYKTHPKIVEIIINNALILCMQTIVAIKNDINQKGIIHNDLKPENILFECSPNIQLISIANWNVYLHKMKVVVCDYGDTYSSDRIDKTISSNRGTANYRNKLKSTPDIALPYQIVLIFALMMVPYDDENDVLHYLPNQIFIHCKNAMSDMEQRIKIISNRLGEGLNHQKDVIKFIGRYFTPTNRPQMNDLMKDEIFYNDRKIAQTFLFNWFNINRQNAKNKIIDYSDLQPITDKLGWT